MREENRRLKLAKGGELDADDDLAIFDLYLTRLGHLLAARHKGGPPNARLYDEYNESLVQLSDDHLREMCAKQPRRKKSGTLPDAHN